MTLLRDNLFGIVDGSEKAPTDEESKHSFKQRSDKALSIIVMAVDPELYYVLGDAEDPKVVWKKLEETFRKNSWSNKLHLLRKLYGARLQSGGSLKAHLKELEETARELALMGEDIKEDNKVAILLSSLPENFNILVTALETLENAPSWNSVVEKLQQYDNRNSSSTDKVSETKALVTHRSKGVKCYHCNKLGHMKKDCYKLIVID